MQKSVIISDRFEGPPGIGNGGYVCGLMAAAFDHSAQITLRKPALLNQPMQVTRPFPDRVLLHAGNQLIAEAGPTLLKLNIPAPPAMAEISTAQSRMDYGRDHPFPHCFVCGPERVPGDGLRLFPAHFPRQNLVADLWEPDVSLADENGWVCAEYLWSALDCPGGIAAVSDRPRPIVLGRLRGHVTPSIKVGERCRVIGWRVGNDGRKHTVGTALFSNSGAVAGYALAIWIELNIPAAISI